MLARQHIGTKVDVPGREATFDERRARRQRQRRLRDVLVGVSEDPRPEFVALGRGRRGADQHAIPAGAVDFLDDDVTEMRKDMLTVLGPVEPPGRHVVQHRLFCQVELDHVRYVGVDRLVVGHAGSDGVGQRDAAGAIRGEESGNAKCGFGPEHTRVEEIVVDPAVDHVDSLRTFRRAHVYGIALNEKVDALDQLDAHLLGQECMFVIGGVVGAGGENGDRRRLPT